MRLFITISIIAISVFSGCKKSDDSNKADKKEISKSKKGKSKVLNKELCDILLKKGKECKMNLFVMGIGASCKANMNKRIKDYDRMVKWSKMSCEDLKVAWKILLDKAKKRRKNRK